jgi:hypothetical protein
MSPYQHRYDTPARVSGTELNRKLRHHRTMDEGKKGEVTYMKRLQASSQLFVSGDMQKARMRADQGEVSRIPVRRAHACSNTEAVC